jgi:stearoyl-CoA desaturase (delta-9 desaturase)
VPTLPAPATATPAPPTVGAALPLARFALLHLAALSAFVVPFEPRLLGWFVGSYTVRMFGVTAGYHRYFSHRAYRLGRVAQALMAVLAQTSGQKGVLWWAAHHREHHRHADRPGDVHSPRRGFWWAHVGWILAPDHDRYDARRVSDFGRFPELRGLDRHHWVPSAAFGGAVWVAGGFAAFAWGYLLASVALYHATFAINSVAHLWGSRSFATPDGSRNNLWLAILTLGEGWHNNHHDCRSSCRQGVHWWEIDITYAGLRLLEAIGIAADLRPFVVRKDRRAA